MAPRGLNQEQVNEHVACMQQELSIKEVGGRERGREGGREGGMAGK